MGTVHIEPKHEVTRPLTKKQRNDVFKWLEAAGWSPGRFQWGMAQADQRVLAALVYKADQDYLFAIDPYAAGDMSVTFRPGADEVETEADELHWSGVETYLILWLHALRDELEEPDLWANLGTLPDVAEGGDSDHNEPFSREEVRVIGERVDRVRGLLEVASLAPDVLADVNKKLDHLIEATDRLGRFDWRALAVGILFEVALAAAFDPSRARQMMEMVLVGLRGLLGPG
jgi:hypothetical protein